MRKHRCALTWQSMWSRLECSTPSIRSTCSDRSAAWESTGWLLSSPTRHSQHKWSRSTLFLIAAIIRSDLPCLHKSYANWHNSLAKPQYTLCALASHITVFQHAISDGRLQKGWTSLVLQTLHLLSCPCFCFRYCSSRQTSLLAWLWPHHFKLTLLDYLAPKFMLLK